MVCVSFRGDLSKLFDWETFINEQKRTKTVDILK